MDNSLVFGVHFRVHVRARVGRYGPNEAYSIRLKIMGSAQGERGGDGFVNRWSGVRPHSTTVSHKAAGPESHSFSTGGCHVEPRTSRVFTMNGNIAWSEAKVGEPSPLRGAYWGAYSCPNGTISPESEARMPTEVIESKECQTGGTGRCRFSNPRVGSSSLPTPAKPLHDVARLRTRNGCTMGA